MKHTPYKIIPYSEKWECIYDSDDNHVACVESNKANDIVHAVKMHSELVRLLRATAEYLDRGDYPENETQHKLFNDVERALSQAERK